MKRLKNKIPPGEDSITLETVKVSVMTDVSIWTMLAASTWQSEKVCLFYQKHNNKGFKKGDALVYDNWQGTTGRVGSNPEIRKIALDLYLRVVDLGQT